MVRARVRVRVPKPTHVRHHSDAPAWCSTVTMAVLTMVILTMATPAAVQRQHGAYEQRGLVCRLEGEAREGLPPGAAERG